MGGLFSSPPKLMVKENLKPCPNKTCTVVVLEYTSNRDQNNMSISKFKKFVTLCVPIDKNISDISAFLKTTFRTSFLGDSKKFWYAPTLTNDLKVSFASPSLFDTEVTNDTKLSEFSSIYVMYNDKKPVVTPVYNIQTGNKKQQQSSSPSPSSSSPSSYSSSSSSSSSTKKPTGTCTKQMKQEVQRRSAYHRQCI